MPSPAPAPSLSRKAPVQKNGRPPVPLPRYRPLPRGQEQCNGPSGTVFSSRERTWTAFSGGAAPPGPAPPLGMSVGAWQISSCSFSPLYHTAGRASRAAPLFPGEKILERQGPSFIFRKACGRTETSEPEWGREAISGPRAALRAVGPRNAPAGAASAHFSLPANRSFAAFDKRRGAAPGAAPLAGSFLQPGPALTSDNSASARRWRKPVPGSECWRGGRCWSRY